MVKFEELRRREMWGESGDLEKSCPELMCRGDAYDQAMCVTKQKSTAKSKSV